MDLTENLSNHPNLIISAQSDQCIIGEQTHTQSIIIPSNHDVVNIGLTTIDDLTAKLVDQLCSYEPEVIIIATGDQIIFPTTEHLTPLVKLNIGLEILSNQAAARTFNVLLAEERKAVCLMILQPSQ